MALSAQDRSTNARRAALARWAAEDPRPNAERGQRGLKARFEREARQAEPGLPDQEYTRRAECAYRAHMLALSQAAVQARRAGRAAAMA